MSVSIQEQKDKIISDELSKLRQQAYEALMDIGANVAAEKIILNDLSTDSQFRLATHKSCVVGWAYGGPTKSESPDFYTENFFNLDKGCSICIDHSNLLYRIQMRKPLDSIEPNPIPSKQFLEETLKFVEHFKENHNGH